MNIELYLNYENYHHRKYAKHVLIETYGIIAEVVWQNFDYVYLALLHDGYSVMLYQGATDSISITVGVEGIFIGTDGKTLTLRFTGLSEMRNRFIVNKTTEVAALLDIPINDTLLTQTHN